MNRNCSRLFGALVMCFTVFALAAPLAAAENDLCKGRNVRSLGGAHAVTHPTIRNVADLQKRLPQLEASIRAAVAKDPSLSPEVADAVIAAIRSGAGITERKLGRSEPMSWMAYQPKKDQFDAIVSPCVNLNRDYDAFEFTVEVAGAVPVAPADAACAISVLRNCEHDNPTFAVDVSGSHRNPRVTMAATGEAATAVALSGATGSVADPLPYSSAMQFTVRADGSAPAARMARELRFVIPKVCGNLAYVGEGASRQIADPGAPATCEKSVVAPMCKPWADVASPGMVVAQDGQPIEKGHPVTITPAGGWHGTSSKLEVTGPAGSTPLVVDNPTGPVTYTPLVPTCDDETYNVRYTTQNAAGETAESTTGFAVAPHDLIARGFLFYLTPQGDDQKRDIELPFGAAGSETYKVDDTTGVGFALERMYDRRWGVEGAFLYGTADTKYTLTTNGQSGSDSHTANFYALTVGPNLHLLKCSPADLYIGAFLGYGGLADPNYWVFGNHFHADLKAKFVYGAQLGLDVPFGRTSDWGLHGGIRYLVLDENTDAGKINVDPLGVELGLAYRF